MPLVALKVLNGVFAGGGFRPLKRTFGAVGITRVLRTVHELWAHGTTDFCYIELHIVPFRHSTQEAIRTKSNRQTTIPRARVEAPPKARFER